MFGVWRAVSASAVRSRGSATGALSVRRSLHGSIASRGGHGLSQHRDTDNNTAYAPFEFTAENEAEIQRILAKYPAGYARAATIPLLHLAQKQNDGWLPLAAMNKVAKVLQVPEIFVYETATFYTMFNREKVGKYHLELCTTTPCELGGCGSKKVLDAIRAHLKIDVGETTADGLFTLYEVECLGACVNAPMMQIGEHYYEDLTPETVVKLLDDLRVGRDVRPGPQCGRRANSVGPQGRTTLSEPSSGPQCKDLGLRLQAFKDKQVKK